MTEASSMFAFGLAEVYSSFLEDPRGVCVPAMRSNTTTAEHRTPAYAPEAYPASFCSVLLLSSQDIEASTLEKVSNRQL